MKGMIKFYNKDKGFGFVVGENNQEYYFNHKAIAYGELPAAGCHCEFEIDTAVRSNNRHRNQPIKSIKVTHNTCYNNNSGKTTCQHCGVQCVPRVFFSYGTATHSVCPFCGKNIRVFIDENYVDTISPMFDMLNRFGDKLGLANSLKRAIRHLHQSTQPH